VKRRCYRDGKRIPQGQAVLVGIVEQGSGAGHDVWACRACVQTHGLLPLSEHPADSDGTPRTRGGPR
jgi:hypothetical protein